MELVLLGMHRSGTSLVSNYLTARGIFMGEKLLGPNIGNVHGHFEDEEVLEINEQILREKKMKMLTINHYKDFFKIHYKSISPETKSKIKELVQKRNLLHSIWGWKEPRSVVTFDEWSKFLNQPFIIAIYRDYRAVTQSLIKRGTDLEIKQNGINGLKSWILYNFILLSIIKQNKNRILVCSIDNILESPNLFQAKLNQIIGAKTTSPEISFENIFKAKDFTNSITSEVDSLISGHPLLIKQAKYIWERLSKFNNFHQK